MPRMMRSPVRGRATTPRAPRRPRGASSRPDFLRLAIAALVVMVVSRVQDLIGPLASLRPGLLLLVSSMGFVATHPQAIVRTNVLRHWWVRLILAVVIQAILSVPFGISLGSAAKFVLNSYSTVLVLVGLTVLASRTTSDLKIFLIAFLVGLAALAFQTNFYFKLTSGEGLARLSHLFAFDANDVGLIYVTGVPLLVALVTVWKGPAKPALLLLIAAVGIGIARTGSRGAFLALVIAGGTMLLFDRAVAAVHRLALAGALVVGLLIAAPPGYFEQMLSIKDPTQDYNWTEPYGRKEIAKRGIGYMLTHPFFGVGISNFNKAECTISPRVKADPSGVDQMKCAAPHNTWVQVGAELGVPGLILWVLLLFVPMLRLFSLSRRLPLSWRKGDEEQRFLFACASALPISLLGFIVASTFLTFAWFDLPYLLIVWSGTTWLLARRRMHADRAMVAGPRGESRNSRRDSAPQSQLSSRLP